MGIEARFVARLKLRLPLWAVGHGRQTNCPSNVTYWTFPKEYAAAVQLLQGKKIRHQYLSPWNIATRQSVPKEPGRPTYF